MIPRLRYSIAGCATALVVCLAPALAAAQSTAAYKVPHTADGQPDLQGFWQVLNTASWDILDHQAQLDTPAGRGVVEGNAIPYQPWALEKKQQNSVNRRTADPAATCNLPGVPRATYMPYPFQIVQSREQVSVLYEYIHATRLIFMTGQHPQGIDWWMGDSRGHWEGDTLVVDVVDLHPDTWFDHAGNFHSDALHVVERYTRTGPDHMRYEATIEDPKVFTGPWKMSMTLYRRQDKNMELFEYECYAYKLEEEWKK